MLSSEVERLTSQLRIRTDEIAKEREQARQLSAASGKESTRVREVEHKAQLFGQEIERLNSILKLKLVENEQLLQAYVRLEALWQPLDAKYKDCLCRVFLLSSENERLALVLRQQFEQIDLMHHHI